MLNHKNISKRLYSGLASEVSRSDRKAIFSYWSNHGPTEDEGSVRPTSALFSSEATGQGRSNRPYSRFDREQYALTSSALSARLLLLSPNRASSLSLFLSLHSKSSQGKTPNPPKSLAPGQSENFFGSTVSNSSMRTR